MSTRIPTDRLPAEPAPVLTQKRTKKIRPHTCFPIDTRSNALNVNHTFVFVYLVALLAGHVVAAATLLGVHLALGTL